jgi:hypothetical protein
MATNIGETRLWFLYVKGSILTASLTEDGKEMKLDCESMGIKNIIEEVDRHSRMLQKEADLADA